MIKHTYPYIHYITQNFLDEDTLDEVSENYAKFKFLEKKNDLFHFYQTDEITEYVAMKSFKSKIAAKLDEIQQFDSKTWLCMFAAYYFAGNYLLCHDDMVERRKYAFTFYLEDYDSGEFVVYDNSATKEIKRINVRKNTLLIFEVSKHSYHEVAYCKKDGRKSITGWLYVDDLVFDEAAAPTVSDIIPSDIQFATYDMPKEGFSYIPEIEYDFSICRKEEAGPFYNRKVEKLYLERYISFEFDNYHLVFVSCFKFRVGDYILLTDCMNLFCRETVDVLFLECLEDSSKATDFIAHYLDKEGIVKYGIPYKTGAYVIKKEDLNLYFPRASSQFNVAIFSYILNN